MGVLLRGGQVMDPGAGLTGALDVRVRDGLVTEVRAGLAPDGDTVLDVSGRLVLPGLIDLHAHCFAGAADFGPRTDDIARSTGVTTWVDGGSTGAGNFEGMREWVLSRSRVRMFAFLNISAIGLTYLKVGELNHLPYADVDAAVGAARAWHRLRRGARPHARELSRGARGVRRGLLSRHDLVGSDERRRRRLRQGPADDHGQVPEPGHAAARRRARRDRESREGHRAGPPARHPEARLRRRRRRLRAGGRCVRLRGRPRPAHHRPPPLRAHADAARGRDLVAAAGRPGLSVTPSRARTALAIGAAVLAMLIYASQFVLSRWSMQRTLSLWDLAALRFTVAGLVSLPVLLRHRPAGAVAWRRVAALSAAAGAPYTLIMYAGLVLAPAAHGAVIVTGVTAVVTTAVAWPWFGVRPWPARTAGLVLVVIGLALVGSPAVTGGGHAWLGDALFIVAGVLFALFTVGARHWRVDPLPATAAGRVLALPYVPI